MGPFYVSLITSSTHSGPIIELHLNKMMLLEIIFSYIYGCIFIVIFWLQK